MTRRAHDDELPLKPGVLYREPCPAIGQLRMYAVDVNGARCFEITVSAVAATISSLAGARTPARSGHRPFFS